MKDNTALYLYKEGTNYESYKYFGSHREKRGKKDGVIFRVYAPRAESVSVVGDFNGWDKQQGEMNREEGGVFELFIEGVKEFDGYKYLISTNGREIYKADPFAYHSETPPLTNSKYYELKGFKWEDGEYFKRLKKKNVYESAINIYEVHFESWKKNGENTISYLQAAKELVRYVKETGYTHIELMPICEYPFGASWGYQVTGYFAATSRFGTPKDLMCLINECHKEDIGVIFDFVPAHFPKDEHGLYEFDGGPLYESGEWHLKEHKTWGTRRFDYGRGEVQSFLISSANFWFDIYHADGLRVDAVASMLYLDYDKKEGEWLPNEYGDNKNLQAISFLKKMNEQIFSRYPYALMIAEESTAYPMVTAPTYAGGLGFNFKWNMGWMNDILEYFKTDPYFRSNIHGKLTFSMFYAFAENFILPLSHDEVVYGKKSLLNKMPGSYEDKFAQLRAFYGYMYAHPGKKLMFMTNDIAQFDEWDYRGQVQYDLLKYPMHRRFHQMARELNGIYRNNPPLYTVDYSWQGFRWLSVDDAERNVIVFERKDAEGGLIVCAFNFSGADIEKYTVEAESGKYEVIFNSDRMRYGGKDRGLKREYGTVMNRKRDKNLLKLKLNRFSALYLKKI